MKNVRIALAGALALVALIAVVGCGSDDDDKSADTGSKTTTAKVAPKVAFLSAVLQDYQQQEARGMKDVAEKNGGSVKTFNANFDPTKTLSQCKDAISSGLYNSIIIATLEPSLGVPCVALAEKAKIPVAAIDGPIGKDPSSLKPQVPGVVGGVYSTPKTNAEQMVKIVGDACADTDPCKVIAEIASPTDPLTNGMVDALKAKGFDVVATVATNFDPGVLSAKLPDVVSAHKDANVFVGVQDFTALAALPIFAKAGLKGKVKLIGNGGSAGGAAAVKSGDLFATVGNWPRQQGALVTEMLVKALNGEKIEPNGLEVSEVDDPDFVTKDTVDEFKPEWGL